MPNDAAPCRPYCDNCGRVLTKAARDRNEWRVRIVEDAWGEAAERITHTFDCWNRRSPQEHEVPDA